MPHRLSCNHSEFQDPTLNGTNVSSTSNFQMATLLILLMVGKLEYGGRATTYDMKFIPKLMKM